MGKPVRVRTIEFLCKLYDFFYPQMVFQAFQIRLVITSKKAISGNIGRFYQFGYDNNK